MNAFRLFLLIVLTASIGVPLGIRHRARQELDRLQASLEQQAEALGRLNENQERSAQLAVQAGTSQTLSAAERLELLALRSEVGRLRKQTNLSTLTMSPNPIRAGPAQGSALPLAQLDPAQRDQVILSQEMSAVSNISFGLHAALQRYAAAHSNRPPSSLLDLREYFGSGSGSVPGLYSFDFLDRGGPLGAPADALVLRGSGEHAMPDGKRMRLYAFADGRIVQAITADGDFDAWESQQKVWPPRTNQMFRRSR